MKKTMMGLALLTMGLGGMAGAQAQAQGGQAEAQNFCNPVFGCNPPSNNGGNYDIDDRTAQLYEDVRVTIPAVVAMHLHETSWNINLADLDKQKCYRAGDHSKTTGRDFTYPLLEILRASTWKGDGNIVTGNNYSFVGSFSLPTSLTGTNSNGTAFTGNPSSLMAPQSSYPGIVFTGGDRSKVEWKGPMICMNQKIVQKFSNAQGGWTFKAQLEGKTGGNVPAGFPTFMLGDQVADSSVKKVEMLYNAANPTAARPTLQVSNTDLGSAKTTGGWLDDHIIEAIVLDGNETNGVKEARVSFTLTGNF
ncbi:hypothetical protein F8S09_07020 [Deinococcus sp. SDU3-2]|uniref:Uncharacterized protein n=1 Tax=Deinococcus terrestris TaxID=2651870 RepID=A0A7X1TRK9_9DEIO|nr:hypothetical protein [Deinococcus terrestris]MPY66447.1 hypothetical protein [Deinococcus terrestris]